MWKSNVIVNTCPSDKCKIFYWNNPKGWEVSKTLRKKIDSLLDQSSHVTYLTWYRLLLFFQEFTSVILFLAWFQDSGQIKGRGTFSCLVWSVNESDILNLIYLKIYLVCEGQNLPCFWKIFIFNPLYNFKIAVQIYKPIM